MARSAGHFYWGDCVSNFNKLIKLGAAQQTRLLGGVKATFQSATDSIPDVTVLIDRDVEVMAENGMTTVKRTVATLLKAEVGEVDDECRIITDTESFKVLDVVSDDGIVIEVYVRG